jgi:hypothetical protein
MPALLSIPHSFSQSACLIIKLILFRIDANFEMRTSEYVEICISIDDQNNWGESFYVKWKEGERKQSSGETEREREGVCVCVR